MPDAADCGMLSGLLEAVEASRIEADRTWGAGRLEWLAGLHNADLLARFRRQQASWSEAYQAAWDGPILTRDLLDTVQAKAAAMQRAWRALETWASEAGHRSTAPFVWEILLQDGTVAAFVQGDQDAAKVIADGRFVSVYTAREVACILDALPAALVEAKRVFPGAKFIGSTTPRGWSDGPGDDIPFGDQAATGEPAEGVA